MKLINCLWKQARLPQNVNKVKFQAILPMKLKNSVSGKSDRTPEVPCLHELSILFASLKDNEFDNSLCNKEIETLQKANVNYLNKKLAEKQITNKGIMKLGRDLNFRQLNKYLKGFPNPK